ncbi:hypothetical protein [Candidatus Uabimicrobium sp. HlEnr_7]|uniref:dioxygenase family protein n=1 Tax=Candidatus Uabimicrobium helgolandensis TaxID=3095367 RepID=UPI003557689A
MNGKISRRKVLGLSIGLFTGLFSTLKADCEITPEQTEGPFYPDILPQDKDNDLTVLKGSKNQAVGKIVYIFGVVRDENCHPIDGAIVEIWQACESGSYNHGGNANTAPLDEHFQYWGRFITDEKGRYAFKTIVPGSYAINKNWQRPPHVHFKTAKRGFFEMTTQMYFAGNPLNEKDRILNKLSKEEQELVVVELQDFEEDREYFDFKNLQKKSQICYFDIVLEKVY